MSWIRTFTTVGSTATARRRAPAAASNRRAQRFCSEERTRVDTRRLLISGSNGWRARRPSASATSALASGARTFSRRARSCAAARSTSGSEGALKFASGSRLAGVATGGGSVGNGCAETVVAGRGVGPRDSTRRSNSHETAAVAVSRARRSSGRNDEESLDVSGAVEGGRGAGERDLSRIFANTMPQRGHASPAMSAAPHRGQLTGWMVAAWRGSGPRGAPESRIIGVLVQPDGRLQ